MKSVVIAIATLVAMSVGSESTQRPTGVAVEGNNYAVVGVVTSQGKTAIKIANMDGGEKPEVRKKTKADKKKIEAKKRKLKKQKAKKGGEKVRPEGETPQKSGVVPKA